MIPKIVGVSKLQRGYKSIIDELKKDTRKPVFLNERDSTVAVMISISEYERIINKNKKEEDFWLSALGSNLSFWDHHSNEVYEDL